MRSLRSNSVLEQSRRVLAVNRDPTTSDPLRMYTAIGDLLTLAEAAARLRVSARSVRREISDGHLAAVQVRTRLRVSTAELARYIAARETRCQSARGATNRQNKPACGDTVGTGNQSERPRRLQARAQA